MDATKRKGLTTFNIWQMLIDLPATMKMLYLFMSLLLKSKGEFLVTNIQIR